MGHHRNALLQLPLLLLLAGCGVTGGNPRSSEVSAAADSRAEKEALFSARLRCADEGWRQLERETKGLHGEFFTGPSFAYDPVMNTCLYQIGYLSKDFRSESLFDLLTYEQLATYSVPVDPAKRSDFQRQQVADFEKRAKELFDESKTTIIKYTRDANGKLVRVPTPVK